MKSKKTSNRSIFLLAVLALVTGGLFFAGGHFANQGKDAGVTTDRDSGVAAVKTSNLVSKREERKQRASELMEYSNEANGEKLRLVLDRVVLRGEDGVEEVFPLRPVATPETLGERLDALSAPMGVFPLAYVEGGDESFENLRLITSEIRAKMPREKAERLASEHGLRILDFPDYAPDWVIFDSNGPLDALAKIGAVRGESEVASADVLIGRRPTPMALPNDPLFGDQWYLSRSGAALTGTDINVEDAWDILGTGGVLGTGIKIGIIDSGIQTSHPDFAGNIDTTIDKDFVGNDDNPNPQGDENHGTAVAGVAGARGNNGLGVSGVAPRATLVGERLITGVFTSDRQNAEALAHRVDVIQIKNNSWGYGGLLYQTEPLLKQALESSAQTGRDGKGTIFTFAAGNSGDDEDSADYSELTTSIYTITVGATDSLRRRAFYSEPGASVVITAPSNGFRSSLGVSTTDRTGSAGYNTKAGTAGDYADDFSGTSSSCPVVSGVIALMLEKNPELGWRDVQDILIRSAVKFNPAETGWTTNGAGLHFNNDYGAGLVDATAAVNLAENWTNLEPQTSVVARRSNLGASIPNNSAGGRTVQFQLPTSNLVTEHVTVKLNISHTARGELEIFLTSPAGTVSKLASKRNDGFEFGGLDDNYDNYTFSTVHNWAENSSGVWTLRVADRSNSTNTSGGQINSAELTVFGVEDAPENPAPNVQITSPDSGAVFSPGVGFTVNVNATDFDIEGDPDTVTQVELFQNDVSVGIDEEAPYSFTLNPANGTYSYVAKATDPDDAVGSSFPVFVTVKNQTPVINGVVVSATGQGFDDEAIVVSSVDATDPEMDPITLAYKWQFSTDEVTYNDSPQTTATLPADPTNSGKLWRCSITASDADSTSDPFLTEPVNLLDRPLAGAVNPGSPYSYQSGLVLRGDELLINRRAIIHEFSQGPGGGTSEWIEILTLQEGSLSGWSLFDGTQKRLTFNTTGVWDSIPAGTLIVVYNGSTSKDPVVPADSTDPTSGKMIISSTNAAYFETFSEWPTLDNLGESLFLVDSVQTPIHEISYGNSLAASPNVGQVISGGAAYYAGETDAGASSAGEWLVTSASVARTTSFAIGPETQSLVPGVTFTNGRYEQNFDTDPGFDGSDFPAGWSAYAVDLANTQTTNYDFMEVYQGGTSPGAVFNFGSKIGLFGGIFDFDPGFIALGIDDSRNVTGLKISYEILQIFNQPRSMDIELQYTVGIPGNTGTFWTPIAGTLYQTGANPSGTLKKFTNVSLPAIFEDRDTPIYLRWYYSTSDNNGGTGGRDAFALDNVIISSLQSPNVVFNLTLNPSSVSETVGAGASTGTVTISEAIANSLTINITSSDISEATVPATVVIPAGQLSATFPIATVDDNISDGSQSVTITVSATDFVDITAKLTVTDNEPSAVGVTPGLPNNAANRVFIERLRTNRLVDPPLFRLATGSVLPDGLSLDPATGLISGTLSQTAVPGSYPVTIELTNILGGFTSQSIVINVLATGSFTYSSWIALFTLSDQTEGGDPDLDQLPNIVEYALNSFPGDFDQPSPVTFEQSATEISITYSKAKNRPDVELVAEWSTSLENGSWQEITGNVLVDGVESQTIKATLAITPGDPKRFIRLRATRITPP